MTTTRFQDLAVTGIGACTSVGLSAEQCSASVLAGLNRFMVHPNYLTIGKSGGSRDDVAAPTVAMVPTLDPELSSQDRLLHLLMTAFKDLLESLQPTREMIESSGFFVALPTDHPQTASFRLAETFVPDFVQQSAMKPFAISKVAQTGNTGMADLIREAAEYLARGELERVMIAGVDSYFVGGRLGRLDEDWRLKSPRNIGGFIPGEGASVIMLERVANAEARGAPVSLRIEGLGAHTEPNPILGDKASSGQGLSEAIRDAVGHRGEAFACDWVIGDLNGEAYKALEWGTVLVRLQSLFSNLSTLWHPADCAGDIGAATPGLHLAQAAAAFGRGYAPSDDALVLSTSDDGRRTALLVSGGMN